MTLPDPPRALGAYLTSARHGDLLFLSGMLPVAAGTPKWTGRVGRELTVDEGRDAARLAALNGLAVAAEALDGLGRVRRVIRLSVHIACDPEFMDLARVADGASEALLEVLGPRAEHARLAFGAAVLPKGMPVELEMILAVE